MCAPNTRIKYVAFACRAHDIKPEHRLNRPGRNTLASKCGYKTEKCGFGIEQKDHFPDC